MGTTALLMVLNFSVLLLNTAVSTISAMWILKEVRKDGK